MSLIHLIKHHNLIDDSQTFCICFLNFIFFALTIIFFFLHLIKYFVYFFCFRCFVQARLALRVLFIIILHLLFQKNFALSEDFDHGTLLFIALLRFIINSLKYAFIASQKFSRRCDNFFEKIALSFSTFNDFQNFFFEFSLFSNSSVA